MTHSDSEANCQRRNFLASTLAGMSTLLLGCRNEQPKPASVPAAPKGWIDAHIHLWTSDTRHFPLAPWAKVSEMQPASFTAEEYLALARPARIQRAVLVQHAPLYGYDSSYLSDCCRRFPGVFSLIGMIDERLPRLDERLRQLRAAGLRGLRINPTIHADRTPVQEPKKWLKTSEMRQLWQVAADLDVALCPLLTADLLPTLEPMCAEFSKTKCVIDHLGRVNHESTEQVENLLKLSSYPNVFVKVSAFYQFGSKRPPYLELAALIERLVKAYGSERLLWGSDCPYQLKNGNNLQDSVALIESRLDFLTVGDRQVILHDTAEGLFFA